METKARRRTGTWHLLELQVGIELVQAVEGGWRGLIKKGLVGCHRGAFSELPCKYSLCSGRMGIFESF